MYYRGNNANFGSNLTSPISNFEYVEMKMIATKIATMVTTKTWTQWKIMPKQEMNTILMTMTMKVKVALSEPLESP